MRAKEIRIIDVSNNKNISGDGLASIVYNLAFSPKLEYLKLNNCVLTSSAPQLVESLYKFLRNSTSIE